MFCVGMYSLFFKFNVFIVDSIADVGLLCFEANGSSRGSPGSTHRWSMGKPSCLPRVCSEALCISGVNGESCLVLGRKEIVDPREGKERVALCAQWW